MLLVANLAKYKIKQKTWRMTESLANGYSSESTQRELSKGYQHDRVSMVLGNICVLVLWMKVALSFEPWVNGVYNLDRAAMGYNALHVSVVMSSDPWTPGMSQCMGNPLPLYGELPIDMTSDLGGILWPLSQKQQVTTGLPPRCSAALWRSLLSCDLPFQCSGNFLPKHKVATNFGSHLTLSCWYSWDSSRWALSDEYPCARVSIVFQFFCVILYWPN